MMIIAGLRIWTIKVNDLFLLMITKGSLDVVSNMAGAWTSVYDHRHFICSATGICVGDAEDLGESAYQVHTPVTSERLKEIYENELNKWYQKRNETAY